MVKLNNGEIEMDFEDVINAIIGITMMQNEAARENRRNSSCTCQRKARMPRLTDFVDRVVSQDNATIIFWNDGTKSIVKCTEGEKYDYEKGIAMAVMKSMFGNRYYRDMQILMEAFPHVDNAKLKAIEQKKKAEIAEKKKAAAAIEDKKTKKEKKTSEKSDVDKKSTKKETKKSASKKTDEKSVKTTVDNAEVKTETDEKTE